MMVGSGDSCAVVGLTNWVGKVRRWNDSARRTIRMPANLFTSPSALFKSVNKTADRLRFLSSFLRVWHLWESNTYLLLTRQGGAMMTSHGDQLIHRMSNSYLQTVGLSG